MIKYKITINNGQKEHHGFIETAYPLVGDEPIIQERVKAILKLIEPDENDEYMDILKATINHSLIKEEV